MNHDELDGTEQLLALTDRLMRLGSRQMLTLVEILEASAPGLLVTTLQTAEGQQA